MTGRTANISAPAGELPEASTDEIVRAVEVRKSFGDLQVLKGVSLTVRRGEVVVIIGPSGSGKTTFVRCLNHLEKIDSGRIFVNCHLIGYREVAGRLVEDRPRNIARQRREIGMVFQRFNLFQHKTALGNVIEAPVHVLGVSKAEAIAAGHTLLARVGLSDKEASRDGQSLFAGFARSRDRRGRFGRDKSQGRGEPVRGRRLRSPSSGCSALSGAAVARPAKIGGYFSPKIGAASRVPGGAAN